ncbi:hypothetical protein FRX31_011230 [Thalictrum thalictroides]|uniref:Uncharacterized protein n=1 Tax=Thalictrum thalictroides TaxID=46969 RepID=A0A7J6WQD8_THATH|nr:hypothetical protein FRX31_011230 [Thalictrum thalictroides]
MVPNGKRYRSVRGQQFEKAGTSNGKEHNDTLNVTVANTFAILEDQMDNTTHLVNVEDQLEVREKEPTTTHGENQVVVVENEKSAMVPNEIVKDTLETENNLVQLYNQVEQGHSQENQVVITENNEQSIMGSVEIVKETPENEIISDAVISTQAEILSHHVEENIQNFQLEVVLDTQEQVVKEANQVLRILEQSESKAEQEEQQSDKEKGKNIRKKKGQKKPNGLSEAARITRARVGYSHSSK